MSESTPIEQIAKCLLARRFRYASEDDLQEGIAQAFAEDGIPFTREVSVGLTSRIDFLVDRIGVEVKTKGALASVTRQLYRYAASDQIGSLVLVTTRAQHRGVPQIILGKACHAVWLCSL